MAPSEVTDPVAAAVATLAPRLDDITDGIVEHILEENPQLGDDRALVELLAASVGANVSTAVHVVGLGIALDAIEAPVAAVEYARRLAQRDLPLALLIRAYRLGHATFVQHAYRELAAVVTDQDEALVAGLNLVEVTFSYIDRLTEHVIAIYSREREQWLTHAAAVRTAQVRSLLDGDEVDLPRVESALGYRLDGTHVGLVAWAGGADGDGAPLAGLEPLSRRLAESAAAGGRLLAVPRDESSAWIWLASGSGPVEAGLLEDAIRKSHADVRLAVGGPARGLEGFRRTIREAQRAEAVAVAAVDAAPPVTMYADVAPIALMTVDLEATREWVRHTLGALAVDDEAHGRLRRTLHEFLATNGSFTETAQRLSMHKNTVLYRVRKAEEIRGRPVGDQRLEVELALLVCRWLGPGVLTPAA